jgi:hypothetical protein
MPVSENRTPTVRRPAKSPGLPVKSGVRAGTMGPEETRQRWREIGWQSS